MNSPPLRIGGIVLCGGRSSRMGQPKALLPVGDEVMLQRVVRLLSTVVGPIVVVAAADQVLPELAFPGRDIRIARDPVEYRGPLAGLAVGLAALGSEVDAVYASACDAPLLKPTFVQAMIAALGDAEIAVPIDGQFHHPLAAVYRSSVLPKIEELLAADRLRPVFLYQLCRTVEVPIEQLRAADPELDTLCNTNTPEEYERALQRLSVNRQWPPYTHIPGVTPHPINDPRGHSFGVQHTERTVTAGSLEDLCQEPECQRGLALFDRGYYWEAHEEWEALWQALGRTGPRADFIKGLIKLAAAGVKVREHQPNGITRHAERARELFEIVKHDPIGQSTLANTWLESLTASATSLRDSPPELPGRERTGQPLAILPRLSLSGSGLEFRL